MPYLGNVPAEAYTNTVKDSFNGDGSTTAFTLSQPSTTNNLRVVVENVIQDPTVAYSCSGTTLTFTSAPPSGTANIYAVHLGPATMTVVPPAEITTATTYTSALTVQGAFTSKGIDDNADATAITIDSSENVGIGTSSLDLVGSTTSLTIDKSGGNGQLSLKGNGTVYGRIFADNATGDLKMGNPTSNDVMFYTANVERLRILSSGGITFNGDTSTANALNDYEEGTWTPTFLGSSSNPTVSYALQNGRYTKIGRLVYLNFIMIASGTPSGGSGNLRIGGLPFPYSANSLQPTGFPGIVNNISIDMTSNQIMFAGPTDNTAFYDVYRIGGSSTSATSNLTVSAIYNSGARIDGTLVYEAYGE